MAFARQVVNKIIDDERCFYKSIETSFINVTADGGKQGRFGFNDCYNIEVINSNFNLKYLFWNNYYLKVKNSNFTFNAEDAFWKVNNLTIQSSNLYGPRSIRDSVNIVIDSCFVSSNEFAWKTYNFTCKNSKIFGFCTFFECNYGLLDNVQIIGDRTLYAAKSLTITNSFIDSKDCLTSCENLLLRNCTVKGDQIGWYSSNVTLENCRIIGRKPFCFAKNIRFISCEFCGCDECFEQSEINGNTFGYIKSIKDPLSGYLIVDIVPSILYSKEENKNNRFVVRKYRNY